MPGFLFMSELSRALSGGQVVTSSFRKVPSQASTAGWWVDLSMASGSPVPNFYADAPLAATTLTPFKGIFHGDDKSPKQKYLTRLGLVTPSTALIGQYMLLDYVMYYPFIDFDDTATQIMDNTVTLPRYTSGEGLQAMLVAVAPTVGGGIFTFDYLNQNGDLKTSPVQSCGTAVSNIATLVTGQRATVGAVGPFLQLANGDTGIRAIVSVSFTVPNGGLGALVLVKPLVNAAIREINVTMERDYSATSPLKVRIYDGAYLGLISNCAASPAAAQLFGYADFTWN